MENYVSFVTVEALNSAVLKSRREGRVTFTDQLVMPMVGGTLGLFSGISVLSLVEILCFLFNICFKRIYYFPVKEIRDRQRPVKLGGRLYYVMLLCSQLRFLSHMIPCQQIQGISDFFHFLAKFSATISFDHVHISRHISSFTGYALPSQTN